MDAGVNGGQPTFIYGYNTGQNTGVKYAPAVPTTTVAADSHSTYDLRDNTITIVVPRSGVGSPPDGSALSDLQARTFSGQADMTTASSNLAIDSTGFGSYTVFSESTCNA